ncbi:MAG: cobyrinic acid a,c-diamide synthase [Desulfovibrionaceae bacterium]|nr:cobyrinic acid a,c-diamide synthase [Desulfovibrionaceae bacterium]MBF0512885.1 cobyrinic acid a,c-diamide synthase [Desulfovibrionaceae bacterium]
MNEPIGIALDIASPLVRQVVEQCLADSGGFAGGPVSPENAELCVVESGDDLEPALDKIAAAARANPGLTVFVVSRRLDSDSLIRAMRAGVREFFPLPPEAAEFTAALSRFKENRAKRSPAAAGKRGRVASVIGAKGGVGVTTVAVNLAASYQARAPGAKVVLLDMTIPYGEVQLFLDVRPKFHWGEAVRNISRLDAAYLMGILARHPSGLYLLPPPSQFEDIQLASPESIGAILELLARTFDLVVVDLGIYIDEVALRIMDLSEVIYLVAVQHLACLANVKRFLEQAGADGPGNLAGTARKEKFRLILNRHLKECDLSAQDMEEAVGMAVHALIPNDYQTTLTAINQGRPLCEQAPKSEVAKSLAALAASLDPEAKTASKGGALFKLKLFSKR